MLTLSVSGVVGAVYLRRCRSTSDAPLLLLIDIKRPWLFEALRLGYWVMAFTTPCLLITMALSAGYIFLLNVSREARPAAPAAVSDAQPAVRTLFLVLGETHHPTPPGPVSAPAVADASRSADCSPGSPLSAPSAAARRAAACIPTPNSCWRYRAHDPARRLSALVLEVKGDFCYHLRRSPRGMGAPTTTWRSASSRAYRYNPLHNDLEAYTLAYGIASLLNNLFGRSDEPFWQQAYTNLVKFTILLHKVVDGTSPCSTSTPPPSIPTRMAAKLKEGERKLSRLGQAVIVAEADLAKVPELTKEFTWSRDPQGRGMLTDLTAPLAEELRIAPGGTTAPEPLDALGPAGRSHSPRAARGGEALVRPRLDAHRAEAPDVNHRGHLRLPLALRRQPRGQVHVLPAEGVLRPRRERRRSVRDAAAPVRRPDRVRPHRAPSTSRSSPTRGSPR